MKRGCYSLMLLCVVLTPVLRAAQSANLLTNGSFEIPVVPAGQGNIPAPAVDGWDISGDYWAIFTSDGGVSPIPDGVNQLYLYSASAVQKLGTISDYCDYEFSVKVAANSDLESMQSSFAVMEAVSYDGSRVYELAKTFFNSVTVPYVWHEVNLEYHNLPASGMAGCHLRVRIYAAGMLNVDNALVTVSSEEIIIDDFEGYGEPTPIGLKWTASAGAQVLLERESAERYIGRQSMKVYYRIDPASEAEVRYDMSNCVYGGDLRQSASGQLGLHVQGNRVNTSGERLFFRFYDAAEQTAAVYCDYDLSSENGIPWIIDISRLDASGIDVANIQRIAIGVENITDQECTGVVYVDHISLPPLRQHPYNADITGDETVNMDDLKIISENWLEAY